MRVDPPGARLVVRHAALGAACAAALDCSGGCGRAVSVQTDAGWASDAGFVTAPSAVAAGAPRPGMVWIPAGIFRAGTPIDRVPRIADEELPGVELGLGGFYIDVLPYPNEAGAIPTTNVTRDDAAKLCEAKSKRLCTELEWERACKGPSSTSYEYGDAYHAATCGTGVPVEQAAKRPSGERQICKSAFGVAAMHGGPWEWTDSAWGRGTTRDLGVLRGGNALAGELVGRCANGLARPATSKSPTMGLRCCAGPKNDTKVDLPLATGQPIERSMKTVEFAAPLLPTADGVWGGDPADGGPGFAFAHAWTWHPVANEELMIASGCAPFVGKPKCGLIVARVKHDESEDGSVRALVTELTHVDTGFEAPEIAEVGDARHLRMKGVDATGPYLRDFTYAYGRIELGDVKR